jgi:group I intron endonuclease
VNGKKYYGSATNLRTRRNQHFSDLRHKRHANPHLQAAFDKYGESAFAFDVIEYVDTELLLDTEQRYLDSNTTGYNIAKNAKAPWTGRKMSDETKRKMSIAQTGRKHTEESKRNMSIMRKGILGVGRKQSPETIEKRRIATTGRRRSPEARMRMSIAAKKREAAKRGSYGTAT